MNAYHRALQVYPAQIHYMTVLSEFENYPLPTNADVLVKEYYNKVVYPWYAMEQQLFINPSDDFFWFLNYE